MGLGVGQFGLPAGPRGFLGVEYGDGRHGDYVLNVESLLQNGDRPAESHQNRADGLGTREASEKLVSDVRGLQTREYQDVGFRTQPGEAKKPLNQIRIESRVGLHFAIDDQLGGPLMQNLDRPADFFRERMPDRAEVRKREQRGPRLHSKSPGA